MNVLHSAIVSWDTQEEINLACADIWKPPTHSEHDSFI